MTQTIFSVSILLAACLRILLDKGADVDCLNSGLNSPLLLAAAYGHDTVARILIGHSTLFVYVHSA